MMMWIGVSLLALNAVFGLLNYAAGSYGFAALNGVAFGALLASILHSIEASR